LFRRADAAPEGYELTVDLERQRVTDGAGFEATFAIDPYRREMLLRGLDEIGRTLLEEPMITAFERGREAVRRPA
jgi:3-isopropylmalate/(R)-2-methylmalate dehydratase small subunit